MGKKKQDHSHVWESCETADSGQICADCGVEMSVLTVLANEEFIKNKAYLDGLEAAAVHCEKARTKVKMIVPDKIINDTLKAAANEIRKLKRK